jgi:hypothetical protein
VATTGWQTTPPLTFADCGRAAAGLIGRRGLSRNIGINLRTSRLFGAEADGAENLDLLLALRLPATLTEQSSAPDRLHFYWRWSSELEGEPGYVSFRFEGGRVKAVSNNYYICAPSLHPSGAVYTILDGGFDLEAMPELPLEA